ncbi:hypothetical protein [Clostridium kluyveri]|nr:hypothetical protein [Clostridium kluyveri]
MGNSQLKFDIKSLEMEKNNNLKIASNLEVEVKNLRTNGMRKMKSF